MVDPRGTQTAGREVRIPPWSTTLPHLFSAVGDDGLMVLTRVFVYGTLLPGGVRWPLIGPYVHTIAPARVGGMLYDTGHGYPGARFADDERWIEGSILHLHAPTLGEAIELLDEVEGVGEGLFERVVVEPDGQPAWSYSYLPDIAGLADLAGRWTPVD
ncbi:MAG: gamma-glutamylcyclotransferase [Actinomycetia bacterium]|nr:gamma-glutamylcyclotransferase [Actinomycetes bacterium]